MAVEKKECYRVVTIQFLKDFCSGIVAPKETKGLTYCPTYKELTTNNSIISTWAAGTTPNLDRAGITVNSTSLATGKAYTDDQCVDQKDISVRYTTYDGITVSANPTEISECGGSTTLSYSKSWTRYTKSITSCTESNYSTATTSTAVTDTTSGGVSWSVNPTDDASITNNILTLEKNGTVSSVSRDYVVTGSWNDKSNTVTITQNALTGDYTTFVTTYTVTTAITASADGDTTFDCSGGTYKAKATKYYDTYTRKSWTDSCGENYPSLTADTQTGTGDSAPLSDKTGSFSVINPCDYACNTVTTRNGSISFVDGGVTSNTVTFTQSCTGTSGCNWSMVEDPNKPKTTSYTYDISASTTGGTFPCTGGSVTIEANGITITDITTYYISRDNCGHYNPAVTTSTTDSSSGSTPLASKTFTFASMNPCDIKYGQTSTSSSSTTFTFHDKVTPTITYTQSCDGISGKTWSWVQVGSPTTEYELQAYRETPSVITDCSGGVYSANAIETAYTVVTEVYIDNCGHVSGDPRTTRTQAGTTTLDSQTGEFGCCPSGICERSATLFFSVPEHGTAASIEFKQESQVSCPGCDPDCVSGVDNGSQVIGGVEDITGPWASPSGSTDWSGTDTILIDDSNCKLYLGGTDGPEITSTPLAINDWLEIRRIGMELQYRVQPYKVDENPSADIYNKFRTAQYTLSTDKNTYHRNNTAGTTKYRGMLVCQTWDNYIFQPLCGYEICRTGRHANWTTVPAGTSCCESPYVSACTEPCGQVHTDSQQGCKSSTPSTCPSTTYSFTVSTVQGANVTMTQGSTTKTYITNSSGLATYTSTSNAAVSATISKSGCKFPTASLVTVTIQPNTTQTVQYSCESCTTCPEAGITNIVPLNPIPSGYSGGVVLTFNINGNCTDLSKYNVIKTNGANLWNLSTLQKSYDASNKRIIISCSVNTGLSPGTPEMLAITFNDVICKTFIINQG